MGRAPRPMQRHLAGKLLTIRKTLDLTQEQLIERLGYTRSPLATGHVSDFEQGKREPPLELLLRYSRLANVYVEALIDDDLKLPKKLPAAKKSEGTK